MSYSYILVSLKSRVNNFSEFSITDAANPKQSSEQIRETISDLFPLVSWSTEGDDGIVFGCTPCESDINLEVWIFEKPNLTLKITAMESLVLDVAEKLNLSAIDMQTGEFIFYQNSLPS